MERLSEEIEWYFDKFIQKVQECQDAKADMLPYREHHRVRTVKGRKYWAIWIDEKELEVVEGKEALLRSRIFGFVRIKDGAILRPATWRAPETRTKTAVRGYIYDSNVEDYFTWVGIRYAG